MEDESLLWNEYLDVKESKNENIIRRDVFLKQFEQKWNNIFSNSSYDLCQLNTGNRLRPQILYLGYLANCTEQETDNLDYVVDIGISIELIHKSSLLLDDLIDGDEFRHGKPTFHTINGNEKTILYALHLLSKAFVHLKTILIRKKKSDVIYRKCIDLSLQTMYDLSLGALNELSLTEYNLLNLDAIKEVIQLETSTLIRNSLLLGYYSNGGCNSNVEDIFIKIGDICGYVFQSLNDLEPFCNSKKNGFHKGIPNTDYIHSKKNIVVAYLYEILSQEEKRKFDSINITKTKEVNNILMSYFDKYNIKKRFIDETDELKVELLILIENLKQHEIDESWCSNFKDFISILIEAAKCRLNN